MHRDEMLPHQETQPVAGATDVAQFVVVVGEHARIPMLDDLGEQRALVLEIAVDGAFDDLRALGDVGNQRGVVTFFLEDLARRTP